MSTSLDAIPNESLLQVQCGLLSPTYSQNNNNNLKAEANVYVPSLFHVHVRDTWLYFLINYDCQSLMQVVLSLCRLTETSDDITKLLHARISW